MTETHNTDNEQKNPVWVAKLDMIPDMFRRSRFRVKVDDKEYFNINAASYCRQFDGSWMVSIWLNEHEDLSATQFILDRCFRSDTKIEIEYYDFNAAKLLGKLVFDSCHMYRANPVKALNYCTTPERNTEISDDSGYCAIQRMADQAIDQMNVQNQKLEYCVDFETTRIPSLISGDKLPTQGMLND